MPRPKNRIVQIALHLCLLAATIWQLAPVAAGGVPEAPGEEAIGGDFTLTDYNGKPFRLSDVRGKVVLMFFGYTSCPDVCPTTLMMVKQVLGRLGGHASEVQPLFVSVDPRRDTPSHLKAYVSYFDTSIIGATGTEQQLRTLTRNYKTFYRYNGDVESGNYEVDHGSNLYVIDRNGDLARIIPFGTPVDTIATIIGQVELDAS